jgi:hypothetical protein
MTQDLEHLKKLVFSGGFDEESKEDVRRAEARLKEALAKEKLLDTWPLKGFIDYLNTEVESSEILLKTDRTLTTKQRDNLFNRISICKEQLSLLSQERKGVEENIKTLLERAKSFS